MNKKIFKQIRNEWQSNLLLFIELFLVSVIMWFIVDYLYINHQIYRQPLGFDISNCYELKYKILSEGNDGYIEGTSFEDTNRDMIELRERIRRTPGVEAVGFGHASGPYSMNNSGIYLRNDSLNLNLQLLSRSVTPDFIKVFRYQGARGETPEQLAEMLQENTIFATDNIAKKSGIENATSLIGCQFRIRGNDDYLVTLKASLQPIRYSEYSELDSRASTIKLIPDDQVNGFMNMFVRVKPEYYKEFPELISKESAKQFTVGNVVLYGVIPYDNIRQNYLMTENNEIRNFIFGAIFLMLNVFIGLLGTFWFRTNKRRSEIALHKTLGATNKNVFLRLISESMVILVIATIPAIIIDYNLTIVELNESMNDLYFTFGRFIITVLISFALIASMMIIGIVIPARRAMKIRPALALRNE